jgi:hypothetical protein
MSFQLNTATALPAEVQLGKEKPQGAFALRSRYALSANSASSWNAGTTLTLPLQTGTPGTFTDVKQGIIQATVQIVNTNPYVDFLNFGPSGAMIFFDEMRVYSSGTPVEENLRYSETADLLMIQGGHQCRPFHMFRRNKWRAANGLAGDKHINFIKPSMVDALGVPMYGRTPFMDKNSAVYCPPSISIGTSVTPLEAYASEGLYNSATQRSTGSLLGTLPFYDGNIKGTPAATALDPSVTGKLTKGGALNPTGQETSLHRLNSDYADPAGRLAPNNPVNFKNAQYGRSRNRGDFSNAQSASYVPSQWPDFQPSTLVGEVDDEEIDSILGKAKISEYMKYLCNVRGLPVGVKGITGVSYCDSTDKLTAVNAANANQDSIRYVQYRVSMPFLSGIYGIFADKMFPDMLIGANNMRIEFKLAQNVKALWTTMDPCRRVPGTLRDFVPFTGTAPDVQRNQISAIANAVGDAAWGCRNALVMSATQARTIDLSIVPNSQMYNCLSALGQDLVNTFAYGTVATNTNYSSSVNNVYGTHQYSVSNLPKPQYVPVSAPWNKEGSKTYVNENAVCYGTYLPAAQAQSRRCWPNTKLQATTDNFANAGQTYFTIRDIQYIGEQVQLDDVVTSAIIQSAATSEVVVWTRGYRSFEASCDQNAQQNIILPIQIGQAEALYLIFRPSVLLTSPDYYSNSFCCPFVGLSFDNRDATTVALNDSIDGDGVVTIETPDVGGSYTLNSSLDTAGSGIFSYQLFSGTKQYPLQPIQTVSELITEREKSIHSLHNWDWCSTENMALTQWGTRFGNSSLDTGLDLDPFLDFGYFTTFVPVLALDDQTITQNPYFQIVELSEVYEAGLVPEQVRDSDYRIRGRRCPASTQVTVNNGAGSRYSGVLNMFTAPVGSFYLGWDFESWTNHQDVMRTGKFLGQEQISVRMTGTYLCNASSVLVPGQIAQMQTVQCTAIVPHVVKLSFVPGGHMLSYY